MAKPRESIDAPLREFLAALSSAESAHGAVSAAAISGGLGTSLLQMVAALPKTRSDSATDRTALISASAGLGGLQEQLLETIETETIVKVYAARNMPQRVPTNAPKGTRRYSLRCVLLQTFLSKSYGCARSV